MKRYNVILVLNPKGDKILMVERAKEPYKGLMNLPGGKIEEDESDLESAYRELAEETGIKSSSIELRHMMGFSYYEDPCQLEVFVGRIEDEVTLVKEAHDLHWVPISENFYGEGYAGEGNIGHMMAHVRMNYPEML